MENFSSMNDLFSNRQLSVVVGEMGYIKLARKIIESKVWSKPPLYLKVWLYLLLKAQHTNYKQLKAGQLFISIPEIIEGCSHYVGARKEKPTKDQIFQIIDWLRKPDEGGHESNAKATMIATTKATHGMIITVCKYEYYQSSLNYEGNVQGNDEISSKTFRKQRTPDNINKNDKNDNNDNINYSPDDRKENFYQEVMEFKTKYSETMLKEFFNYWSELNAKRTKMKFELQKTFQTSNRLVTWNTNNLKKSFTKNNSHEFRNNEPAKEFGKW